MGPVGRSRPPLRSVGVRAFRFCPPERRGLARYVRADPDMEYPARVDGARHCPPEDVGGADGFMGFLEAVLDPAHEEHRYMVRWYGGPFDPIGFDEARARFGMENMARRRRGSLASHRSGLRRSKR